MSKSPGRFVVVWGDLQFTQASFVTLLSHLQQAMLPSPDVKDAVELSISTEGRGGGLGCDLMREGRKGVLLQKFMSYCDHHNLRCNLPRVVAPTKPTAVIVREVSTVKAWNETMESITPETREVCLCASSLVMPLALEHLAVRRVEGAGRSDALEQPMFGLTMLWCLVSTHPGTPLTTVFQWWKAVIKNAEETFSFLLEIHLLIPMALEEVGLCETDAERADLIIKRLEQVQKEIEEAEKRAKTHLVFHYNTRELDFFDSEETTERDRVERWLNTMNVEMGYIPPFASYCEWFYHK